MTEPVTSPIADGDLASAPRSKRPSAAPLLLLAAVFPGLPHLLRGRRAWAALLALPVLLPLLALVLWALATSGLSVAARFIDPAVLTLLVGVQALLLVWRLVAIGAVRVLTPIRMRASTVVALVVAIALVVVPQAVALNLTLDARDAASAAFQPVDEGGAWVPDATAPPVSSDDPDFGEESPSADPGASDEPSASPSPSPTPQVPRINVLLIGVDAGVGRNTFLTDSMIVASLDPVAKTVSMASIPRDMVDVPLPDGRKFKQKINSLVSYVNWHKGKFPGAKDGESVLAAAVGTLLNLKIDLWAEVNLGGFAYMVDSLGGINIKVTSAFCDYRYKEYGIDGFKISPGWWHMNGNQALAYARVRKAAGESDFTRAARQQEVIAAIRDRVVKGGFLENPSKFLKSAGQTVRTNIKPSFIADWIDTAVHVGRDDVYRIVIGHPYVKPGHDARGSIQIPDLKAIRKMAAKLFTPTGTRPTGFDTMPSNGSGATKNATSSSDCGRPTRRPSPRPSRRPNRPRSPPPSPPRSRPTRRPRPRRRGRRRLIRPNATEAVASGRARRGRAGPKVRSWPRPRAPRRAPRRAIRRERPRPRLGVVHDRRRIVDADPAAGFRLLERAHRPRIVDPGRRDATELRQP
ncbi:MAG: LCP family protein [Chloroflexota bacterium]